MMAVPRSGKFFKLLQSHLDEMKGNTYLIILLINLIIITFTASPMSQKGKVWTAGWLNLVSCVHEHAILLYQIVHIFSTYAL